MVRQHFRKMRRNANLALEFQIVSEAEVQKALLSLTFLFLVLKVLHTFRTAIQIVSTFTLNTIGTVKLSF